MRFLTRQSLHSSSFRFSRRRRARCLNTRLRKTYSVQERRQTTPCGRLNSQHFRCKKQDLTYLSRHSRPPPRPCSLSSIVSLYILYCKPRGAPPATRHNRAHYINADQRGRSCRPGRSEADRRDRTIDRTSGLGPSHPPAAKGGKRYAVSTPVMCRHRRWAVPGGRTEREVEEKNGPTGAASSRREQRHRRRGVQANGVLQPSATVTRSDHSPTSSRTVSAQAYSPLMCDRL